jgi:uncharacterized protein YbaR (Trm112 family)
MGQYTSGPLESNFAFLLIFTRREEDLMTIQKELLEILACPQCKGPVVLSARKDSLVCRSCGLLYPIRDDIPVMLIDEAVTLKESS